MISHGAYVNFKRGLYVPELNEVDAATGAGLLSEQECAKALKK